MGLVPVLLDTGCWYMENKDTALSANDDWKMTGLTALIGAGNIGVHVLLELFGASLPNWMIKIMMLVKIGSSGYGGYTTYSGNDKVPGDTTTYLCYGSNGVGLVYGIYHLFASGSGQASIDSQINKTGGFGGGYYYSYY